MVCLLRGGWPSFRRSVVMFAGATAVLGFLAPFGLEITVAPHLPVFLLVVLIATMPLVTYGLSTALGIERLHRTRLFAVIGGLGSVILIAADLACPTRRLGNTSHLDHRSACYSGSLCSEHHFPLPSLASGRGRCGHCPDPKRYRRSDPACRVLPTGGWGSADSVVGNLCGAVSHRSSPRPRRF